MMLACHLLALLSVAAAASSLDSEGSCSANGGEPCSAEAKTASPVVIAWPDLESQKQKNLTKEVAEAFGEGGLGLILVCGVPDLQEARQRLLRLSWQLAHLSEETLRKYERPDASYCLGWSRGREKFKGNEDRSKGSFYANPIFEDPADGNETLRSAYPYAASRNVWVEELPELKEAFKAMGQIIWDTAGPLVQQCDRLVSSTYASHGSKLYEMTFEKSRMAVARLLHYFPDPDESWCGWHTDNSVITGLVPEMYFDNNTGKEVPMAESDAGLYVKSRQGEIVKVSVPSNCLGLQIGEAAQIMSGGVLRATPHHVKGPRQVDGQPVCRDTFAFFMEPQWDAEIGPPDGASKDEVLKGSETELIIPLSSRWKPDPDSGRVVFGKLLGDSFAQYYAHNPKEG